MAQATARSTKRRSTLQETGNRSVGLSVVAPDAREVSVAGDFNDWSSERHPLHQTDEGTWQITLSLPPGIYQYKFLIDGNRWEEDERNPKRSANEFGTTNSILEVV
ncbi:MAG: hypothetical protein K0S45_2952 [Nitrospira sp.]|jgi:1,4-alpha-glucan branching enzyme|nr:hypothetical protein [Nitrospira sp.]